MSEISKTNKDTVLICDDSEAVHESLSSFFIDAGMQVIHVYDGKSLLSVISENEIDLIILDVMMPYLGGLEACEKIRRSSDVPIIFLSARSEEIDRIRGLELGGDDYVTKPFSARELTIKAKNIIARRKLKAPVSNTVEYRGLKADQDRMEIRINGRPIEATAKEVNLIIYLINNAEKVLNREQILGAVWGRDYFGDTRAVDAMVKRIRAKLPQEGLDFEIQSVYGVGYRLGAPQ